MIGRHSSPDDEQADVSARRDSPKSCYPARMDIGNILTELRQEHAQLTEAIVSLERLAASQGKRRGRPPAWLAAAKTADAPKRRGRPAGSKNAGKAQA